jgi:predicted metal-dependent phosphoesterase TrpH
MKIDLHTHTTASDGALSPRELLARACKNNVHTLAITDHDTVAAFDELDAADISGINLIPGIELSARWANIEVHVVGLNIDLQCDALRSAVASQLLARRHRAEYIAYKLQQLGFDDALTGAQELAGGASIGRPHFAQYLVHQGAVKDVKRAFRKFLGGNKLGNLKRFWPELDVVLSWINDAGGTGVLAHPVHYGLTHTKLRTLTAEFVAAGGAGIEVVSGRQPQTTTSHMAELAESHGLLASCGSDFHRPGQHWADVGDCLPLPSHCKPVWDGW